MCRNHSKLHVDTVSMGSKHREQTQEGLAGTKRPVVTITGIENLQLRAQLQEIARKLHGSKGGEIKKSDRRRLVTLAGMLYETQVDPQPVYSMLALILATSQEQAKVHLPPPRRTSCFGATSAGLKRRKKN